MQPLSGAAPHRLTSSEPDKVYWADWSRDGKHLALVRGRQVSNIVMLTRIQRPGRLSADKHPPGSSVK